MHPQSGSGWTIAHILVYCKASIMNLSNAGNTFAIAFNPAGYKYIVLSQLPSHRQFYIFWTTDASGKIYVSFFDSTAVPHLRYLMKNKTYILRIFNRN